MANELRFDDVKLGDVIASRYALESVVNPDNGEAAVFMCNYDGWICCAKIYYDDKLPDKEVLDKQRSVSSSHIIKKMDQTMYKTHLCQIMPSFNSGIMSKPVNDKIILEILIPGVVDALKAIHENGIIHGHVKPTNIFYNPMGDDVLLGDFGVELDHIGDCGKEIAMNYLPPEAQSGVYDGAADYYSLGISLVQLITGKNPFDGMNKRNAIKLASTMEIELPARVSPIIKKIVKGLTVKDHDTRWGSEEIEKTLAGEDVEVVDNFVYAPPTNEFYFKDEKYEDLKSLIGAFTTNWYEALEAVKEDGFIEFAEGFGDEIGAAVKEALDDEDESRALFKLLYAVNPELPMCWKGLIFDSLEAFADSMKRAEDKEPYRSALADGALLAFEQFRGAGDDTISNVSYISDDAQNGKDVTMIAFKLDYLLSGQYVYMMDGIPFADISTFTSYLQMNVGELNDICHEFINDARFFAWLDVLGYGPQVDEWRAEIA
jgi:hypothetical protein